MRYKTAKIIVDPEDSAEQAFFLHVEDGMGRDRLLVGGTRDGRWLYQEFPGPNPENTMWIGGEMESPFRKPPR